MIAFVFGRIAMELNQALEGVNQGMIGMKIWLISEGEIGFDDAIGLKGDIFVVFHRHCIDGLRRSYSSDFL